MALTNSAWLPGCYVSCELKDNLIILISTVGTPAAVPKLSNAQISEHYSTCIKLSTENVSICMCMHFPLFPFIVNVLCLSLWLVDEKIWQNTGKINYFFFYSYQQKITTKNAFGLHLIDYMADILKQKDSELTNFKVCVTDCFIHHFGYLKVFELI